MYSKCMGTALRYADGETMAKDILQDSFIKIFKNIKSVDVNRKNLEGWMMRVVVNTAIDRVRKNSNTKYITDSIDEGYGEDDKFNHTYNKVSADEDFSERLDGEYIIELIQGLSPKYKLVFNMSVMEGLPHKKIAERLGISEGTSKSNLSKAKKYLQDKIIALQEEEAAGILNSEEYEEEYEYQ
jgi:RNA polymerase sigma-70 factor, ECF subfamily